MVEQQKMIKAVGLTKRYGTTTAVDDLSFACQQGEIVGFLGPNGAGKTTTMRLLTGYLPPTEGSAYIAGHHTVDESLQARQRLGYLPETVPLYNEMTVEGYLAFVGRLRRVADVRQRVNNVLEAVSLQDRASSYIGTLSKGMRQRVGLAQALLHNPDVLILDEPTIGLDPRQIADVRQLIVELGRQHTILLSTHILSEVEQICDRVLMVINGRIWADMSLDEVTGAPQLQLALAAPSDETATQLGDVAGIQQVTVTSENSYQLAFDGRDETRQRVAEAAVRWGLLEFTTRQMSLEALFLAKLRQAEQYPQEETDA